MCTIWFDLGWPRAVENALDAGSAASTFPHDPDIKIRDKHVPDNHKTPSTPAAHPRPRTQALGERKPRVLHVYFGVEHLVRVLDESVLDR